MIAWSVVRGSRQREVELRLPVNENLQFVELVDVRIAVRTIRFDQMESVNTIRQHVPIVLLHSLGEVVALRQAIRTPDPGWWSRLALIDCPTLIIGGGPTSHVDQDRLQDVSRLIATSRFVQLNVGHSIHQSEPEAFAELVSDALA